MKSITNFSVVNKKPLLVVDYEAMEAIKYIVNIAPQEAQWFHTISSKQVDDEIELHLSTKLYIPKQNTSAAQVDSSSKMMIEFYNELKQDHTLEEVNNILSSMNCWCHSHHNMSPNPSRQDINQFNTFIDGMHSQGLSNWQIMLIFNKRNEYYALAYDPSTGHIYEGLDIRINNSYDFSYIDKAAREKFIKPKPKASTIGRKFGTQYNMSQAPLFHKSSPFEFEQDPNPLIAEEITSKLKLRSDALVSSVSQNSLEFRSFMEELDEVLDFKELSWLHAFCLNRKHIITKLFTHKAFEKNLDTLLPDITGGQLTKILFTSNITVSELRAYIKHVLAIADIQTVKQCKQYLDKL